MSRCGTPSETNNINGKKYIGSSVNLRRRIYEYFNINRILKEQSMPINLALATRLKYGLALALLILH
jgi:hypothetical protein